MRDVSQFIGLFITFLVVLAAMSLFSGCFVSGRSITLATPKVEITADTATAYTWPYNTKFQ